MTTKSLRSLWPCVIFMTPLFWLLEVAQNQAHRWVRGHYGWTYSASPYSWFSFGSMFLWIGAVVLIWSLDRFVFLPRGTPRWRRLALMALACFAGEWLGGLLGDLLHHPMQRWTGSPLVYVSPVAYGYWCMNVLCYDLLHRWLSAPRAMIPPRQAVTP
jgi:hypothetical protein